jgi:hypothetical protein
MFILACFQEFNIFRGGGRENERERKQLHFNSSELYFRRKFQKSKADSLTPTQEDQGFSGFVDNPNVTTAHMVIPVVLWAPCALFLSGLRETHSSWLCLPPQPGSVSSCASLCLDSGIASMGYFPRPHPHFCFLR